MSFDYDIASPRDVTTPEIQLKHLHDDIHSQVFHLGDDIVYFQELYEGEMEYYEEASGLYGDVSEAFKLLYDEYCEERQCVRDERIRKSYTLRGFKYGHVDSETRYEFGRDLITQSTTRCRVDSIHCTNPQCLVHFPKKMFCTNPFCSHHFLELNDRVEAACFDHYVPDPICGEVVFRRWAAFRKEKTCCNQICINFKCEIHYPRGGKCANDYCSTHHPGKLDELQLPICPVTVCSGNLYEKAKKLAGGKRKLPIEVDGDD